jgi:hypothetical protein
VNGRAALAAVVLTVAPALTACAPVAKRQAVERVAAAVTRPEVRTGTLTIAAVTEAPATNGPALPAAPPVPPVSVRVVLDPVHRRAALLAPPAAAARLGPNAGGGFPAIALFDGTTLYVRAVDAAAVGARAWLGVDLESLGAVGTASTDELQQPRTLGALAVLGPIELLDLARGFLTGSVTMTAPGSYRGRTSIEKEHRARRLEPSDARPLLDRLRAFAVSDDVQPLAVSVTPDGRLAHLEVGLVGRPEYGVKVTTRLTLAMDDGPAEGVVPPAPPEEDVVTVDDLGDARTTLDAWAVAPVAGAGR